ncbi:SAM-dependent methyltransferase [Wenzhouxiangella sp. XN201]|uniref:class I SAM-dependent methyltransferase n=1 Tax=Wenzhouxiangella sp. XN201 TaxID=2710755 RepID=UPI0013C630E4|nr:SAM-dependent methyltransferase [Wenzhouxiangella sp. XN201]NEZ02774.1 SAM-dependent methyltransferase [Wenzhouxiangella sp. XN201]
MSSRTPSLSLPEPPKELAALSERLCNRITAEIESAGSIPFDRYMNLALYEPGLGYYVNGLHKFGASGDFVTAPEQGGLFARAVARQCTEVAESLGSDWTLMELGAGSGVLARDLLLALPVPPAEYLILEPSAPLREIQRETLDALPETLRDRVRWLDTPPQPPLDGVIIANEVLDALPVARFGRVDGRFVEHCVGLGEQRFNWQESVPGRRLQAALEQLAQALPEPLPDGYVSEICVDLPDWLETISAPLRRGLILMIDYGYPRAEFYHPDRSGGTLVCHYRHRAHFDPFVWPGLTDLSAFVDFTAVAEAANSLGLEIAGFTSQAGFLLGLGIHDAVEQARDDEQRLKLAGELKRLTLPGEMGEKFKVIGLTRNFDERLSGFDLMSQLHRL